MYKPGEKVWVPDEVASAIANMTAQKPVQSPEIKTETISYDPVKDRNKALVVQSDGSLAWVTVQTQKEIPDPPDTDGEYYYSCNVSTDAGGHQVAAETWMPHAYMIPTTETETTSTLGKKWSDIKKYYEMGLSCIINYEGSDNDFSSVLDLYVSAGQYCIEITQGTKYTASSADGYPVYTFES